jgi:hypothetical protein
MVLFKNYFSRNLARHIGFCGLVITIFACQTDSIETRKDYFPLNKSLVRIYEVTENTYTVTGEPTQKKYLQKEQISNITSSDGISSDFILQRYTRNTATETWALGSIQKGTLKPDRLTFEDNGAIKPKLFFPLYDKASWTIPQSNASSEPLKVTVTKQNESLTIGNENIEDIFVVQFRNDSTLIDLRRELETYAPNIGLVSAEYTSFDYCQSTPSCIGKGTINFGTSKKMKLISYSKE